MVAVELQHDGAAPGETGDMRRPEIERVDHGREAVRVVSKDEIRGHVRRATRPRLVPRDDGELVRQCDELWPPHAGIHRSAVDEHERRPFADALVGDLEAVRPTDLHHLNLHAGVTKRRTQSKVSALAGQSCGSRTHTMRSSTVR